MGIRTEDGSLIIIGQEPSRFLAGCSFFLALWFLPVPLLGAWSLWRSAVPSEPLRIVAELSISLGVGLVGVLFVMAGLHHLRHAEEYRFDPAARTCRATVRDYRKSKNRTTVHGYDSLDAIVLEDMTKDEVREGWHCALHLAFRDPAARPVTMLALLRGLSYRQAQGRDPFEEVERRLAASGLPVRRTRDTGPVSELA